MEPVRIVIADLDCREHAAAILSLLDDFARDVGQTLSPTAQSQLIPGLKQHPTTFIVLAFAAARPIGFAVCFFGFSTFAARRTINIHDLGVVAAYRGQGIGRRLIERILQEASRLDCCKVTLEVDSTNTSAANLYRQLGFSEKGHFNSESTMLFMTRTLDFV